MKWKLLLLYQGTCALMKSHGVVSRSTRFSSCSSHFHCGVYLPKAE